VCGTRWVRVFANRVEGRERLGAAIDIYHRSRMGEEYGRSRLAVRVGPVVMFSVLDHHIHRNLDQPRVIGALLGTRTGKNIVVKNCFPVPHSEELGGEGNVAVGKSFLRHMLDMHEKVNEDEELVGWYTTVSATKDEAINRKNMMINDFFSGDCKCVDPLHIVVDTTLANNSLSCKAYLSDAVQLGEDVLAARFRQLKIDLLHSEPERIGLDFMIKGSLGKRLDKSKQIVSSHSINTEIESLESSLSRLLQMLETVEAYVDDVVSKRKEPDHKIGTKIASVVSMVPRIQPDLFEKSFRNNLQDLLMIVYLSNMTRTQLAVAAQIGRTPA